jgi:methyl-accepting chemotaxis protein-1 (serine sensor receptor)
VKLNQKVPLAFALTLFLMLSAGLGGMAIMRGSLVTLRADVMERVADERSVAAMQGHFKTQVQEWKNTLLRGMDGALLDKHWQAFEREEKQVERLAQQLRQRPLGEAVTAKLDRFIAAHHQMARGYREGFDKFKATGLEPSIGDAAVRGIDREPAKLLDELQKDIASDSASTAGRAFAEGRKAGYWGFGLMMGAALLGIGIALALCRAIVKPLEKAIAVARDVATGDLTHPIAAEGNDETAQLLQALAAMQAQLRHLVQQVHQSAQTVANASGEIALGSSDLANRTEQQAAAIQQTAASMDQLGAGSAASATSAAQASEVAREANGVASRGHEVVSEVVDTMQRISESSQRISEIIGVIDGIAFQTNILALNASVEAARAGEQGRGFAVVADEVRALAQRSGDSAREIRSLIVSSVERVERGSTLAQEAGATMALIVQSIEQVSTLVSQIRDVTQSQRDGVRQIGQAVTQIDHGTQQNAALVEQTSAAADSLRQQAGSLMETVSVFRV